MPSEVSTRTMMVSRLSVLPMPIVTVLPSGRRNDSGIAVMRVIFIGSSFSLDRQKGEHTEHRPSPCRGCHPGLDPGSMMAGVEVVPFAHGWIAGQARNDTFHT